MTLNVRLHVVSIFTAVCVALVIDLLIPRSCAEAQNPAVVSTALAGKGAGFSSPVIAEVDGDTTDGKEIVVAGADAVLYVLKATGELLWSQPLPNHDCASKDPSNRLYSSPAVGALLGNGVPYVVVGYGGIGSGVCGGGVVAFKGSTGERFWHFDFKAFARKQRFFAVNHSAFSTPALYDLDGDGKLSVGIGSLDRYVYLITPTGKLRWYYAAADTVFSSPAFADADGDGKPEMIIGTDISQNNLINPPTPNGGYLYALKTRKVSGGKIGFREDGSAVWRTQFNQVIQSSPVIAELMPNNPGKEIVIASGCFFPQNSVNKRGAWVKVLSLKTGKVLRTLNLPTCTNSEPAVSDVNGDGIPDVVIPVNGLTQFGGDGIGRVIAWTPSTNTVLWTAIPKTDGSKDESMGYFRGLALADLDGNGSTEVIVTNGHGLSILSGTDGSSLSCESSSCSDKPQFVGFSSIKNLVAIGDLNHDGIPEIVAAGTGKNNAGFVRIWSNLAGILGSSPGNKTPYTLSWPMFRGDAFRNGNTP